jgi:hypothetical protein
MLESYNTHNYKAQSQPNKPDFYQQVLANASIYRNGLVKARNGSDFKLFSDFTTSLWQMLGCTGKT